MKSLLLLALPIAFAATPCLSETPTDEIIIPPFVVTDADGQPLEGQHCPVPPGTTDEAYYGKGHGFFGQRTKKWTIEQTYTFRFVRQDGDRLIFSFVHHESIAHAFFGTTLKDGALEPTNAGFDILEGGSWKKLSRGGCYTGASTTLVTPGHEIIVSYPIWMRSAKGKIKVHMRMVVDTGCWLSFISDGFDVELRSKDESEANQPPEPMRAKGPHGSS